MEQRLAVTTDELIRRYQAGQDDLFDALFERYKDYVYRVAFSLLQHTEEAEEAVQETFLDVLRALPRYHVGGPARFETWLYRVTVNRCKMRWRRRDPPLDDWDETAECLAEIPDPPDGPEEMAQQAEDKSMIWRAVGRLGEIYREVIVLRYGHNLAYQEIAEMLEVSVGTVKSRLNAAHRRLQETLDGDGDANRRTGKQPAQRQTLLLFLYGLLRGQMPGTRPAWV